MIFQQISSLCFSLTFSGIHEISGWIFKCHEITWNFHMKSFIENFKEIELWNFRTRSDRVPVPVLVRALNGTRHRHPAPQTGTGTRHLKPAPAPGTLWPAPAPGPGTSNRHRHPAPQTGTGTRHLRCRLTLTGTGTRHLRCRLTLTGTGTGTQHLKSAPATGSA